jgi:hypothetical protein
VRGVSSLRKSAVQKNWMALSITTVTPKVTRSEVNSVTPKRVKSACRITPARKKRGTIATRVRNGFTWKVVASWYVR